MCEKKNKKKPRNFFESLIACILGMAKGIFIASTLNLVLYGSGITELRIHENRDFVNIFTLFAHHILLGCTATTDTLPFVLKYKV